MNSKNQIFSAEKVIKKKKSLKTSGKRPGENGKCNGRSYDIEGGILALKRTAKKEKKERKK